MTFSVLSTVSLYHIAGAKFYLVKKNFAPMVQALQ